ncbi:MAG: hybrid sensor histidine kinase/response regulator [Desulfobulbaceae bacterium]
MADFLITTLDLVARFTGRGGGPEHNIVQFVLAGVAWAALLALALQQQKRRNRTGDRLLVWGFGFGLAREVFMLGVALLFSYGARAKASLPAVFPPLEHALLDLAMVIIAAAYMGFLLKDEVLSRRYLRTGIGTVALVYLATFWWWGRFILDNPGASFGQSWCDVAFRVNASVLMAIACLILLRQTRGWQRNAVCVALFLFFLFQFLKIVDIALHGSYEHVFAPIRHALYIIAIPIFGYIHVREYVESEGRAQQALAESEALCRTLMENIDLGIALIDRNYKVLMANVTQGKLAKKYCGDLIGGNCFREFSHRNEICPQCPGSRAMESGEAQEVIKEGVRGDGSPITVRIRAFPVKDGEGRIQGFIEVVEDISQRVKTEQELQRARHLESIGVLAGGIAHDFNNILAAIFGFTDLALMKAGENASLVSDLRHIRRASERARGLVQQILTLSRRQEHRLQPLRLASLVQEALKLLHSTIPASIEISQDIASQSLIMADASQAHQLVMNLCTNACQAMAERGGVLTVVLRDALLEESAVIGAGGQPLPAGNYVQLMVSDTGTGITEQDLDKIFEPYFTTKEVGRGTGLGLAVVHGIVQGCGGGISVASAPGNGTTFTVTLPVIAQTLAPEEHKKEDEAPAGNSERIMVVDDEENICLLSFTFLSQVGYQVDTFMNGADAWEAFSSTPDRWDLVITDQAMPLMAGDQLVQKIKAIRPNLPIFICTGYSETVNEEMAAELGISRFLQKPVTRAELLAAVDQVLHPGQRQP